MAAKNKYEKQAKLQKLLEDSTKSVDEGRIERTYTAHGLKWTFKPLCDHESNWRNKYVVAGSLVSLNSSMKTPTLAIGIRAIGPADKDQDGNEQKPEPVLEFFRETWDDLESKAKDLLENNAYAQQYFLAEQMFEFLSQRGTEYTDVLWDKWNDMLEEQEEAKKQIKNSSREKAEKAKEQKTQETSQTQTQSGEISQSNSEIKSKSSPSPEKPDSALPTVTVDV
jgi:hypothetical protein